MRNRHGFTLIESVAALILLGIIGLAFFTALSYGIQQYITSSSEAALAQKSLLTLTRMHVELAEIENIDLTNQALINDSAFYYIDHNGAPGSLALSNGTVLQNDLYTLVDGVSSYESGQALFTYRDFNGNAWTPADGFDSLYEISITLRLDSPWNAPGNFTHTVNPRNTTSPNAPKLE